ncbi:MAG: TolC family protein [Elusimicrobia bacterium]|nr:TolC family protein [Elusimicrobiota bacterium]
MFALARLLPAAALLAAPAPRPANALPEGRGAPQAGSARDARPPASTPAVEFSSAGRAVGLQEAFELGLGRSSELAQRSQSVAEAWARVKELWAAVQPTLSFKTSEFVQDSESSRDKPEVKVSLRQPLFTGLREFLAVRVGKARGAVAELELRRAKDLLFQDVAAAYLGLLGYHRQLAIRQALVAIISDRIRELKERERIGRTRRSEVLAAESQRAQLVADFEQAKRDELDAQESLRFLTGLSERLAPSGLPEAPEPDLEGALGRGRDRADVEARRRDLQAARESTEIVRRGRWPIASLDGSYYFKRAETQKDIRWDLTVSAELPLYQGLRTAAQVQQAVAREKTAEEALSLALRKAETEVRKAHADLRGGLATVAALERAVSLAEDNAQAQAEDYRLGLVTNLDVLGALNTLQQARLRLTAAAVDVALARVRLDVAAGDVRR